MKICNNSERPSGAGLRRGLFCQVWALVVLSACSAETPSSSLSLGTSEVQRRTYIVELTDFDHGASASCLSALHDRAGLRKLTDSRWMFYARLGDQVANEVRSLPCVSSLVEVAERPYLLELTDIDQDANPHCIEEILALTELVRSGYSKRNFEFTAAEFIAFEVSQLDCVAQVSLKPVTSFLKLGLSRSQV